MCIQVDTVYTSGTTLLTFVLGAVLCAAYEVVSSIPSKGHATEARHEEACRRRQQMHLHMLLFCKTHWTQNVVLTSVALAQTAQVKMLVPEGMDVPYET